MDISNILNNEARQQGISLQEPVDHILELLYQGKVIARFWQTKIEVQNIHREVEQIGKN